MFPIQKFKKPVVLLLAHPRAGTSFFCTQAESFRQIYFCQEVFNPYQTLARDADFRALARLHSMPSHESSRIVLGEKLRAAPAPALSILQNRQFWRGRHVLVKAFYDHLEIEALETCFLDHDIRVIFLDRNPLDAFISLTKAREAKAWAYKDVTDMKVHLDIEKFVEWRRKNEDWLKSAMQIVQDHKAPFVRLTYEKDVMGSDKNLDVNFRKIFEGLSIDPGRYMPRKARLQRQDKNDSVAAKINNYDAVRSELKKRGQIDLLEKRFDY